MLSVTEFLAFRDADEQEALANPLTGIATKCKFLPTIADMNEFLDERAKRLNTRATSYRYFKPDALIDMPIEERRKAQVLSELGYDPSKQRKIKREPLEPAIIDAIEEGSWSSTNLKTPAKPASAELKALLMQQGYEPWPVGWEWTG